MRWLWLLFVLSPQFSAAIDTSKIDTSRLFPGVVRVEAQKQVPETGAGIVISASTYSIQVITAAHVIEYATALNVYFHSDSAIAYKAHVLPGNSDPDKLDLAVLEVLESDQGGRPLPENINQIPLTHEDKLIPSQHIWTVDGEWRIVPNNVTLPSHDGDPQKFEYTKGSTGDGYSGGAVVDDYGQLVGVHIGGAGGGQYAVAVNIGAALDVLKALGHSSTPNLFRAATPRTQALCSISFERDLKRPTRVDGEASACLDQVALALKQQADATLVIVGESSDHEKEMPGNLAAHRAVNAKSYLVTEEGIDAARIRVETGGADDKTAENYLVPAGATFTNDIQGTTPVNEGAVKAVAQP
jgi:coenzyme F420-reducing hydrogenase delta subunit